MLDAIRPRWRTVKAVRSVAIGEWTPLVQIVPVTLKIVLRPGWPFARRWRGKAWRRSVIIEMPGSIAVAAIERTEIVGTVVETGPTS